MEAIFVEPPGGAKAGHASADDDNGRSTRGGGRGVGGFIAEAMTTLLRFKDEATGDGAIGFAREADEGWGANELGNDLAPSGHLGSRAGGSRHSRRNQTARWLLAGGWPLTGYAAQATGRIGGGEG